MTSPNVCDIDCLIIGGIQQLRGQDEGGGQKMSVFVHAQGMRTVHAGGGSKNWKILST